MRKKRKEGINGANKEEYHIVGVGSMVCTF